MTRHTFDDDFLWGVATSALQIEGGVVEGGRGESIWDRFAATPGRIKDGSNARVACDHYHRWREDIDLMRWLGVGAYRFSIAWSRVMPSGRGTINAQGLDFYDALVDGLLEAGIRPFVTLYHWDLPQVLQDRGGWGVRDTAEAFADYTAAVCERLGDRVVDWATHNEPAYIAILGHEEGVHAPGHRDSRETLRVAHHLLLSHGWAVEIVRQHSPNAEVGIVLSYVPMQPLSDDAADRDATRESDGRFNRWFLDPVFRGAYPQDAVVDQVRRGHLDESNLPFVHEGDLDVISMPIDFLGINYYSRGVVRAGAKGEPIAVPMGREEDRTDMGWEVYPRGLHDLLVHIHQEYKPKKIYITENGAAYADGPDDAGRIADERRVEYLCAHLTMAHRAITEGVPLCGYFAWSLLDNFEWSEGYTKRFGLYWVDFDTHQRIPKDSACWYRDVVAARSVDDGIAQSILRRNP
jgi:beta-glucosidase